MRHIRKNDRILFCFILILLVFGIYGVGNAQPEVWQLKIVETDSVEIGFIKRNNYTKTFTDSVSVISELQNILLELYGNGYITASFDSISCKREKITAFLKTGKSYYWKQFLIDIENDAIPRKLGYKPSFFSNRPVNFSEIRIFQEKVINYCSNHGYPFAFTYFDSIRFSDSTICAKLIVNKHLKILIDSIVIRGDVSINRDYLYNYLKIKPGDEYRQKSLENISTVLKKSNILRERKTYQTEFHKGEVDIYLYPEKKKTNRFNGIVGFTPESDESNELQITGELDLYLENTLKRGEVISFNWQKAESESQDLNTEISYPYLFTSPLCIEAGLELSKEDTIYLNTEATFGVRYSVIADDYVKVFVESNTSTLLTEYTEELSEDYNDVSSVMYGLGCNFYNYDYKLNPRKGYSIELSVAAGNKEADEQSDSKQFEGIATFEFYQPIARKFTLKLQNSSGLMQNKEGLYENELYQIGGIHSIRGFDEESITASLYSIMSLECRYLPGQDANVFAFFDLAWYKKDLSDDYEEDMPVGFGVGFNMQTKTGIFTLNYALGRQLGNPFNISNAKIHVAFTNTF